MPTRVEAKNATHKIRTQLFCLTLLGETLWGVADKSRCREIGSVDNGVSILLIDTGDVWVPSETLDRTSHEVQKSHISHLSHWISPHILSRSLLEVLLSPSPTSQPRDIAISLKHPLLRPPTWRSLGKFLRGGGFSRISSRSFESSRSLISNPTEPRSAIHLKIRERG